MRENKAGNRRRETPATARRFGPAGRNGAISGYARARRRNNPPGGARNPRRTAEQTPRPRRIPSGRSPQTRSRTTQQASQPATRIGQIGDFESEARHGKAEVGRRGDVGTPVGGKSGERTVRSLPLGERSDGAHQHEKRHEQCILYPNQHLANLAFAPRIYNSFGEKKIFRARKIARAGRRHGKKRVAGHATAGAKSSLRGHPKAFFQQIETPNAESSIFFRNFEENTDDP